MAVPCSRLAQCFWASADVISVAEIAWLAGLLEGEACFMTVNRRVKDKTYKRIYVQLVMTDKDVMERAGALMGTRVCDVPWHPLASKAIYRTAIHGDKAAGPMMTIYSFMGERRRKKIQECIATWKASPGRTKVQRARLELTAGAS